MTSPPQGDDRQPRQLLQTRTLLARSLHHHGNEVRGSRQRVILSHHFSCDAARNGQMLRAENIDLITQEILLTFNINIDTVASHAGR